MQHILEPTEQTISRRLFLKTGAAIGGGLMVGWVPDGICRRCGEEGRARFLPLPTYASIRKAR